MATARPFADMLAQFLTIYLPVTRACSPNTVSAYRDAFTLFLRFMDQQQATSPDQIAFADFTTSTVAAFLGCLMARVVAVPVSRVLHLKSGREIRFIDPRRFGRMSVTRCYTGPGKEPLKIGVDDSPSANRGWLSFSTSRVL